MILCAFIIALLTPITFLLSAIPAIAQMPTAVTDGLDLILSGLTNVVHLLRYAYTPLFFNAMIIIALAVLTFNYWYSGLMWVLRKIPFIDIH